MESERIEQFKIGDNVELDTGGEVIARYEPPVAAERECVYEVRIGDQIVQVPESDLKSTPPTRDRR